MSAPDDKEPAHELQAINSGVFSVAELTDAIDRNSRLGPRIETIRGNVDNVANDKWWRALKKRLGEDVDPVEYIHNIYTNLGANDAGTKRIMTEDNAVDLTGFAFPWWKKWLILTSVFIVQLSMNFNAAIFGNAIPGLKKQFGLGNTKADNIYVRLGQFSFLVAYAFGCELWAPWSEELGRKWVLQGSLFFVNLWQIPCALAPSLAALAGFRALGGLSSAGGSVTLGMVADMWEPADQQYAVAFVVFSSCAGSVIAPIFGGFITAYLRWQWVFWISLIFGAFAQLLHLFVPETRSSILLRRAAASMRKLGYNVEFEDDDESKRTIRQRLNPKHCGVLMLRPYKMLLTEPIVGCLSLLSGFSDALIFLGLDGVPKIMQKWDFTVVQIGLCFISLLIGYGIAYVAYAWDFFYQRKRMEMPGSHPVKRDTKEMPAERRLRLLLVLVVLEPIGLFLLGAASLGPPKFHWILPLIFIAMIGVANFAIYMATIDYMVAAYGEFSASATGGNGFCRDLLAGIMATASTPLYENIMPGTPWQVPIPSWILGGIGVMLAIPVYIIYFKGPWLLSRSSFANDLSEKRDKGRSTRAEAYSRTSTPNTSQPQTPKGAQTPQVQSRSDESSA